MRNFADLYARLDETRSTQAKRSAIRDYFAGAAPADAAWALYFLTGRRLKRLVPPTRLRAWVAEATGLSADVIEDSYAHVGDLAETLALLLDTPRDTQAEPRPLADWVVDLQALAGLDEADQQRRLFAWWRALPLAQCYLLNKLLTGALRVGVSSGLTLRALAEHADLDPALVTQRLAGSWRPSAAAYAELLRAPADDEVRPAARLYPFCLATSVDDVGGTASLGARCDYLAEWKWDGIRAQLLRRDGRFFLWSRGEELLHGDDDGRFPEIAAAAAELPDGCVLDGEILAWRGGVLPFATLQRRIGRKTVGKKLLNDAPCAFLGYDLLEWQGQNWRERPLAERRAWLEALLPPADTAAGATLMHSPRIDGADWPALAKLREEARARGVEGLMLKRLDAPYVAGRHRGIWWKWKLDPRSFDGVLVYAQAGHGRRANLYTDYTLAVWDGDTLVPVTKAYSGLTDAELTEMDRWIRRNTHEKFGPVRSVTAELDTGQVFEIAFEGIQASPRHKSGIAMRFPRIARWRRDKVPGDADRIETLRGMLNAIASPPLP